MQIPNTKFHRLSDLGDKTCGKRAQSISRYAFFYILCATNV